MVLNLAWTHDHGGGNQLKNQLHLRLRSSVIEVYCEFPPFSHSKPTGDLSDGSGM